jgi:ribosomal protein S18 acetylase RimI-like enzyme
MIDSNDIRIRLFEAGDEAMVSAFFNQMGGETRAFFNRNDGNRRNALRFFESGKDEANVARFLAESGGRMVGYVFLWDMDRGVPWLGIAVADDWKGRHLGRRLLEHAHAYAKDRGKGGVLLTTGAANVRGQGLYERMGYEHIGTHSGGEMLYLVRF